VTGIPKGVVLNHRGTIDFMDWCFDRLKLDGSERIGSLSPSYMVNISNQGLLELNHWRRVLSGARFVSLYGPIQFNVDCTYYPVEREVRSHNAG
jgi:hypothetical protein